MADYVALAKRMARRYGVPEGVFVRQIRQESGFNPNARSPAGATGIAQIMPATARGWGVNPNDPVASLEAAAKNMGKYIRAYGLEGALRAYNAGPGAIERSKGFAETNNYVKKILNGANPSTSPATGGAPRGTPGDGGRWVPGSDTRREVATFDAEGYASAQRRTTLAKLFQGQRRGGALFASGLLSTSAPDRTQFMGTTTVGSVTPGRRIPGASSPSPGSPSAPSKKGARGPLRELFHDPGINVDDGKVARPIGGHGSHVHAAFDNDSDRAYAVDLAKRLGLTITSEGGGKHAPGSFHYQQTKSGKSRAIDVSGDPRAMRRFNRQIARRHGVR